MKIVFDDGSSVEVMKSEPGKVMITLSHHDKDKKTLTTSSAQVTAEQFLELIKL